MSVPKVRTQDYGQELELCIALTMQKYDWLLAVNLSTSSYTCQCLSMLQMADDLQKYLLQFPTTRLLKSEQTEVRESHSYYIVHTYFIDFLQRRLFKDNIQELLNTNKNNND